MDITHYFKNISNSTEKINEIARASKEQETGITQINDAINSLDKQTQENAATANKTQDIAVDTDRIAKEIVADAQSKEFIGKENVNIQVTSISKTSTKINKSLKVESTSSNSSSKPVKNQTFKAIEEKEDEWETF